MSQNLTLFTVLGWEQRFLLGTKEILNTYEINHVYLICFKDYLGMKNMNENLLILKQILKDRKVKLDTIELEYENSVKNWHVLLGFFDSIQLQKVILNITTFPREAIWTFLFFLKKKVNEVQYIYFKPESYDKSEFGLTKNHKSPRLLFKHSGLFDINKKLAIFIITGFDHNRVDLLIEHFEPEKIVYLSQSGVQYENMVRNCGIKPETTYESIEVENVEIDCYEINDSFELLNKLIKSHIDYNVIVSSQGPKTSAISVYLTYLENNNIGLAYVPAREFSGDYSYGISPKPIIGKFEF